MDSLSLPFTFPKVSSPALSENEMSLNFSHQYQGYHSPFWWRTECRQSHLPVCRMTRRHSISFSSVTPRFVGWRNVKKVIPSVSCPEMSPIKLNLKCLFLQTISLQIHLKIPQCLFKILFPFIYLHTTINTVVHNHFPQSNANQIALISKKWRDTSHSNLCSCKIHQCSLSSHPVSRLYSFSWCVWEHFLGAEQVDWS